MSAQGSGRRLGRFGSLADPVGVCSRLAHCWRCLERGGGGLGRHRCVRAFGTLGGRDALRPERPSHGRGWSVGVVRGWRFVGVVWDAGCMALAGTAACVPSARLEAGAAKPLADRSASGPSPHLSSVQRGPRMAGAVASASTKASCRTGRRMRRPYRKGVGHVPAVGATHASPCPADRWAAAKSDRLLASVLEQPGCAVG